MNANEALLDAGISHQIALERFSRSQTRKILSHLAAVERDTLAKLSIARTDWKKSQLEAFLKEIRALYRNLAGSLEGDLKDFADSETEYHANALDRGAQMARINASVQKPTIETVWAAASARPMSVKVGMGAPLRDWINGFEEGAARRVEQAIRIGFTEGESISALVKRIRSEVLPISRRSAETLARTAVNHISSVARSQIAEANSDIIEGEVWNSILDGRTSTICRDLDGKLFKVGQGKRPPAHPNCRSFMTFKLRGIEAAKRTTYQDWFKRQSAQRQDDILGKAKGRLYRDGKLPLEAFSNNGKELTLIQLKSEYPLIFRAAGL